MKEITSKPHYLPIFLGLMAVVSLTACSSVPDESDSFQASSVLGEDGLNNSTQIVYANAGWVSSGLSLKKNSKIKIQSSGSWTGGERVLDQGKGNFETLWCNAEGCEGSSILQEDQEGFETADPVIYDFDRIVGDWSYVLVIQPYPYNPRNFESYEASLATTRKHGYYQGKLDGKTLCFSQRNYLLAATEANIDEGYYASQRNAWQNTLERWEQQAQRETLLRFARRMRDLYRFASCENPVTEDQILEIAVQANESPIGEDAPYQWTSTPRVFEPVYEAYVPESNYRELCNSEQDIITHFHAGTPSYVRKNECAPTKLSSLIAKIVPDGVDPKEVAPINISKLYEEEPLEITQGGRLYFRSNDTNGGVVNNDGFLKVKVSLAK